MLKVCQSAACAVCLEGLEDDPDMDEYQANLKYWEQHKLEMEEQLVSWQNKKPTVTHRVPGSNMVHWLCHECAYMRLPGSRKFAIESCPICRHVLTERNTAGVTPGPGPDVDEKTCYLGICKICQGRQAIYACVPCGHVAICFECLQQMRDIGHDKKCPECRGDAGSWMRILTST